MKWGKQQETGRNVKDNWESVLLRVAGASSANLRLPGSQKRLKMCMSVAVGNVLQRNERLTASCTDASAALPGSWRTHGSRKGNFGLKKEHRRGIWGGGSESRQLPVCLA